MGGMFSVYRVSGFQRYELSCVIHACLSLVMRCSWKQGHIERGLGLVLVLVLLPSCIEAVPLERCLKTNRCMGLTISGLSHSSGCLKEFKLNWSYRNGDEKAVEAL